MTYQKITATFLDEITYDIPSQNWGPDEWTREFDTFVDVGIDTVVVIRAGHGARLACPSDTVSKHVRTLPVYVDLIRLFLDLCEPRGIRLYFGLYDSGVHWMRHDWQSEVAINSEFIREMYDRYGDSPAFRGWYLPHETSDSSHRSLDINTTLAGEIRKISDLPILASPYFHGRADMPLLGGPRGPEEHARLWDEIFDRYQGLVDHCAFQDATAELIDLAETVRVTKEVATRYGIELWSNTETFDRDMPLKFPPTDWRKLAHRLDAVQPYVSKIITFEFSHFLSPNADWQSARLAYRRYLEFLATKQG
jgi:hypothetical protein